MNRVRICSAVAVLALHHVFSGNNYYQHIASTIVGEEVLVQVDLINAKTVLQIPCKQVRSTSMMNLDYTSPLVEVIPRYSLNITIQTPADCNMGDDGEEILVGIESIKSFLQYMFPLADIYQTVGKEQSSNQMPLSDSQFTTPVHLLARSSSSQSSNMATTTTANNKNTNCNIIRGRVGKWKYNSTYGKESWYKPNDWIRSNELINGPYNHSSWMWEEGSNANDDNNNNGQKRVYSCPIELATYEGFCHSMHVLNLTRIIALGDSIEYMRILSFMETMGHVSHAGNHLKAKDGILRYSYRFDCPSIKGGNNNFTHPIDLVFHRVNHLMPLLNSTESRWAEHKYVHFICYGLLKRIHPDNNGFCPWVKEYMDSPQRTLIVGGVGPHFQAISTFDEHLENFINLIKLIPGKKKDIIWLRSVLPGHENCTDESTPINPLNNFQEFRKIYRDGINRWHGWDKHALYNQRLEAEVIKIKRDEFWTGPQVDLFDIYWMTALRRDGHPSEKDCLHYLLPGPPDWWNHLFYSNLKELAASQL